MSKSMQEWRTPEYTKPKKKTTRHKRSGFPMRCWLWLFPMVYLRVRPQQFKSLIILQPEP